MTSGKVRMDQLVLAVGEYKNQNEHVQLVVRMEERGKICKVGSLCSFVLVLIPNANGISKANSIYFTYVLYAPTPVTNRTLLRLR